MVSDHSQLSVPISKRGADAFNCQLETLPFSLVVTVVVVDRSLPVVVEATVVVGYAVDEEADEE